MEGNDRGTHPGGKSSMILSDLQPRAAVWPQSLLQTLETETDRLAESQKVIFRTAFLLQICSTLVAGIKIFKRELFLF